ncbi:MAG: pilus assembly protein [Alphaproteobacteria bacterium]|nr:pilus assembly protein [Alphaproteobacteria bacterium]
MMRQRLARPLQRLRRSAVRLRAESRAVAAVELAILAPVLTLMGLGSIELANMAICYMRINQVAITVADNTSRAKQSSPSGGAMMREFDVNDTLAQVDLLYPGLQVYNNGRIIVSSLERNADGGQWIHWQRCLGSYTTGVSRYGTEGTGATGTSLTGMGPATNQVSADADSAIMFVEVFYQYQPIFFNVGGSPPTIYRAAAMYVRDDRDLTQIYNLTPTVTVNSC